MSLLVLDPGLESRIVDLGRPQSRSLGVPVGGAADRRSLILGNALIGNPADAPALEVTLKGPRLRANADVGCVLFGAPFEAQAGGYPVHAGRSFVLHAGTELLVGGTRIGARAYLCVRGGFRVPRILNSCSALATITRNETLECDASIVKTRFAPELDLSFPDGREVAVMRGLQADWFDETKFFSQTFTITAASNRMGMRVSANPLAFPAQEMMSEPVAPGAIQVTRDGQCIILGVDGQTIGGYPKIAHVIDADLDVLHQMRPGATLTFKRISIDEATERDRQRREELRNWITRLQLTFEA